MKKIFLLVLCFTFMQGICFAKDIIQFDFPNEGWHKVISPDNVESKKCYVPYNQTNDNYTEMLIFYERILKNPGISPIVILNKQLGKDKNNYKDIAPQYIKQDMDDAIATWCSKLYSTCSISRAFQGNQGIVLVTYINKMPHYSQNIFTNWVNILGSVKLYTPDNSQEKPLNLIEL